MGALDGARCSRRYVFGLAESMSHRPRKQADVVQFLALVGILVGAPIWIAVSGVLIEAGLSRPWGWWWALGALFLLPGIGFAWTRRFSESADPDEPRWPSRDGAADLFERFGWNRRRGSGLVVFGTILFYAVFLWILIVQPRSS